MKICLYLEYYHFLGGILYKKIGTGLLSSYKNQKAILESLGLKYSENVNEPFDILECNTPWLRSIYLMKKAKKQGKKVIIWSHTTVEDSIQVFRFVKYIAPLYKKYLTYAYNLADIIFAPTEYTKSLLTAYGIADEKIIPMSNGINLKKYFADNEQKISGKKKYDLKNELSIGTVALAIPRKGIDTFLLLAKKFPAYQFRWYGKIYNSFFAKALPKDISANMKFTGFVDNINESFNSMDIFVFPSYEENEGMVILEAAAIGLPILVRDIPVYQDWLKHDHNCLKAKNDQEFEQYLDLLLHDENLRKRLSENAIKLAEEKSVSTIAKKTLAIYEKMLAKS